MILLYLIAFYIFIFNSINSLLENDFYNNRNKRAILKYNKYKWTKLPIKYYIKPGLQRDNIYYVIKNFMSETCLTFIEDKNFKSEGLIFVNSSKSSTKLGKISTRRPHYIYLTIMDNFKSNLIETLIFRALGVDYEFNRPDRNKYIRIHKKYLNREYKHNLDTIRKKNVFTYNLHYDFKSKMQLSNNQVAFQNKTVFESIKKIYQNTLEFRSYPSFNDFKLVNFHYCKKTCNKNELKSECKNYGYQNPKDCSQCKCPSFFKGMYCENFKNISKGNCETTELLAKSYYKTLKFRSHSICSYIIKASVGKKIQIKLPNGTLGNPYLCSFDLNLEIILTKDKSISGAIFCDKVKKTIIKSEDNIIFVKWKYSRHNVTYSLQYKQIKR
ncbi:Astacin-like metalloendopeptidase [Strongyloides ratti]|uniref:Astacin-like metalloendopeptidase n=1 Tax=Strongyloides ratti TaxID=34506 RepID=A0A090LKF3_STRRB|nr:Astacin-like metalloendopeptidase [Strongyloides ratti]CEF70272.1 Astacin-like metalloendopeptidase [Strongyloides ratti]